MATAAPSPRSDGIRVCLLSAEYSPARGGVGDYTRLLAGELVQLGVKVSVLTTQRPGEPVDHPQAVALNAPVKRWGYESWAQVAAALRSLRPDVLHIQYQTAAYGMHPAINLLPWRLRLGGFGGRIVTTFHDLRPPYLFPKAGALRHLPALTLAGTSDAIVVVAREHWQCTPLAWLRRLRRELGETTHIIPIGSNIPARPPEGYDRLAWRRSLGFQPEEAVIVFFGYLNASKGIDDLLQALRMLRDRGRAARVLMVGGGGQSNAADEEWRRGCDEMVAELGLRESITWTGFALPEVVSGHLRSGDLCVLPFRDGATFQRGTLLAALAHGLAIVSTRPPGVFSRGEARLPWGWSSDAALVHGENIWLVAPGHPDELALAVARLMDDQGLRMRLGEGAASLAELLTWSAIAKKHLDLYSALVQRKR